MNARDIPVNEISDEAMREIRRRRALLHELLPEALPFVRSLTDAGLITGWRNLKGVWPLDAVPAQRKAISGPFARGDEFVAKPKKDTS